MRALWTATVVLAVLCSPRGARAAGDFDPDSSAWNGLQYLRATAAEANVRLRITRDLDFGSLRDGEVLFVLAPKVALEARGRRELARFVSSGGRLVIADDFRAGDSWMRPFGLELIAQPGPVDVHDAGRADLPIMKVIEEPELATREPPLDRFLGFEVEQVVLNHPGSLVTAGPPPAGMTILQRGPYQDGVRSWMAEVVGPKARVLAIADSSIFINAMLRRHRGNKQFAANAMRYYCLEGRACEVLAVVGAERVLGSYTPPTEAQVSDRLGSGDVRQSIRQAVDAVATAARDKAVLPLMWVLVLLALALPIALGARLPVPVLPPRLAAGRRASLLTETVRAWLASPGADYRRPARQLALYLGRLVAAGQPEQDDAWPTRAAASEEGGGRQEPAFGPTLGLHELPGAIERLVENGRLSEQAARRVCDIMLALQEVAGSERVEMDRSRFTQLAAEVEWAEHVLSHTGRAR